MQSFATYQQSLAAKQEEVDKLSLEVKQHKKLYKVTLSILLLLPLLQTPRSSSPRLGPSLKPSEGQPAYPSKTSVLKAYSLDLHFWKDCRVCVHTQADFLCLALCV